MNRQLSLSLSENLDYYSWPRLNVEMPIPSRMVVIKLLFPLAEYVHTITSGNGKDFAKHNEIAQSLNARLYSAHPYTSLERGLNEKNYGLIRKYFPKACNLFTINNEDIQHVLNKLNNRPKKVLDMNTPNRLLFGSNPTIELWG